MYDKSNFSNQMKRLMKERGVTQNNLALMLHMRPASISRYVTGQRTPDLDLLVEIAKALNVTVNDLLGAVTTTPEINILNEVYFRASEEDRYVLWTLLRRYMRPEELNVIFGRDGEKDDGTNYQ